MCPPQILSITPPPPHLTSTWDSSLHPQRKTTEEGNDSSDSSSGAGQKFRKVSKYVSQDDFLQEIMARFEITVRRVVREELKLLEAKLGPVDSSQRVSIINQAESSSSRTLQLIFANRLESTFFTNSKIVAEGQFFVTVQLVDAYSREVISYAPFGSVRVEIFAIKGDFSVDGQEDLSSKSHGGNCIMRGRDGRPPLLGGELSFSLKHGVGFIENVIFTDNSSWLRSRRFRLGVRAVPNTLNGVQIKEGISEAFVVLEQRGEPNKKHDIPLLEDPLWRLKKISKTGLVCTKLAKYGIHTVQDFLKLYNFDSKLLRDIVGTGPTGVGKKTWETIVEHASACRLDNNLYSYYHSADKLGLLLNSVNKVLGVSFDGVKYQPIGALDSQQMVQVYLLKQYIHCNPDVLSLKNESVSTYPLISSQFQNSNPVCGPSLHPNQGNIYTADHSCQLPEAIAIHGSEQYEPADLDLSYQPYDHRNSLESMVFTGTPVPTHVGTWASTSSSNAQFSHPLQSPRINLPAGGKYSKARWLKVRSVVLWKIVKRNVEAKKREKFVFEYYQSIYA